MTAESEMRSIAHTIAAPHAHRGRQVTLRDAYLAVLGMTLCGYAFWGRSFAYIGIAPLYIGEIVLGLGMIVLLLGASKAVFFRQRPAMILSLLVLWCVGCTLPYVQQYGLDSIRDAAMFYYACFAWIVATILVANPGRIRSVVRAYQFFVNTFPIVIAAVALAAIITPLGTIEIAPSVSILGFKSGDALVHLTGCLAFVTVGAGAIGSGMLTIIAGDVLLFAAFSRGGFLAMALSYLPLLLFRRPDKRLARIFAAAAVGLLMLAVLDVDIKNGERSVSGAQLLSNVESIFSETDTDLEGSKEWRLIWWAYIVDYTVFGDYFWAGKGFGVNLADDDGFQVGDAEFGNPLRSPHDVHMTFLARAGVPGLLLWLLTIISWFGAMLSCFFRARRLQLEHTKGLFLFVSSYGLAFLLNATFDVFLEGPVGAIWFWSVFGLGLGLCSIFQKDPHDLERLVAAK